MRANRSHYEGTTAQGQGEESGSVPPRLYHYTNLESLALILAHRTIRLMLIIGMDDPQEPRTAGIPNLGRFVFASSWTDDKEESIPMCNMYSSV